MEILDIVTFVGKTILMPLGLTLIIVFLITKLLFIYADIREKRINNDSFALLFKSMFQATFDEETLFRIYKNRNEKLISTIINYDTSYERFLEFFLVYAINNDKYGSYVREAKEIINPILQRPYPKVNEREKRILLSIDDTMNKSTNLAESEKSAIKHNLDDLAVVLEENQIALEKSKKANKLTIYGILVSVFFGIISIVLSLIKI